MRSPLVAGGHMPVHSAECNGITDQRSTQAWPPGVYVGGGTRLVMAPLQLHRQKNSALLAACHDSDALKIY
jgi:hypothetical protein